MMTIHKVKKLLFAVIAIIVIILLGRGLFLDQRTNTVEKQTFTKITTNDLIHKYQNRALDQFIEEAIEIDGTLEEVHFKNEVYTLYLTDQNQETYILCELEENETAKVPSLQIGKKLKVKGILKGHLKDIILLHCVIL